MRVRPCRCRKKIGLQICGRSILVRVRQAGDTKVSQARATESGARERFVSAYDSNIGAIRQLFPRDRAQQDLHFDEIATSHAPADASGGDTPTPPTPANDTKSM